MKKFTAILAAILCLTFVAMLCVGCADDGIKDWESNELVASDSPLYRDYYHIFMYGFADSDGDGIGDLKGVESKLDYIADLGFNGIWLSPIFPASTQHKYDVEDYFNIDDDFGTLDDFRSLVEAAHAKGIAVMLDLVINHSSNKHPWFVASQKAWVAKDESNPYYDYYKFQNEAGTQYEKFGSESTMPKLNLDNDNVRAEIEKMCKFWLQDYGVDGFRLDAALHFYGAPDANVKFMTWLMSTAKKYNPDVYMVGEVWTGDNVIYSHYAENSVQSFFNFSLTGHGGSNKLMVLLNNGQEDRASKMESVITTKEARTAAGIDALFASNHDTSRISNYISYFSNREFVVRDDLLEKHKMAIALLYTQTGNVFNYYGNEIGLRNGLRQSISSDYTDHTYRIAMNWGKDATNNRTDGFAYRAYGWTTVFGEYDDLLGGVAEQVDDQNSLYNFYRRVMLLRRQNPEIAQGTSTFLDGPDSDVAMLVRTYNGKSILMIYNLNSESSVTVDIGSIISQYGLNGTLAGFVSSNNDRDVKLKGKSVELPQFSIAVIR